MQTLDRYSRPLRDLRISVTDRCNFRCVYCMPREIFGRDYQFLDRAELLTFEEITRLAKVFVDLGVAKIRLTGGEPLVRRDIDQLVAMLAQLPGLDLTMTTSEGRRLIEQKGVRLDGEVLSDPHQPFPHPGVLQAGKRKFIRVEGENHD